MDDIVQRMEQAYESRDRDRILDLFDEEVVMHVEAMAEPIRGRAILDHLVGDSLDAIENMELTTTKAVRQGNEVATIMRARVTYNRDSQIGGMTLPTEGKSIDVEAAVFLTVGEDGRIREMTRFRDNWTVMREMGLDAQQMDDLLKEARRLVQEAKSARTERPR